LAKDGEGVASAGESVGLSMCADISETEATQLNETTPRAGRRVPFRYRLAASNAADGQPMRPGTPAASLQFASHTGDPSTDRDILIGYQLFLGRDPENSHVILEAKSSPLRGFVEGLMRSGEFQASVLEALARRQPMPHDRNGIGPAPEQIAWLNGVVTLPATLASPVADRLDWREFWTAMIAVPGFPRGAEAAASIANAAVPQMAADQGFILITVEQPKPGDKLHPGALLNGAGWAIAPEDIAEVSVTLDDLVLTRARYGLPRPDVARHFPHYRHVDHCGFAFSIQVPVDAVVSPGSQLGIVVKTVGGQIGRRGVRISPPAPAGGQTAWPIRLFVEDARVEPNGDLRMRGWGLSRARVIGIAVFLGDLRLGDADHGLARPDIAEIYTDYPEARRSGFVFGTSLAGHAAGPAALRVQLTDADGQQRQVIVPVTVPAGLEKALDNTGGLRARAGEGSGASGDGLPQAAAPEHPPVKSASGIVFQCDGATVSPATGQVTATGWAVSPGKLRNVVAIHARKTLAVATLGAPRPDVARDYPRMKDAGRSGFRLNFTPDPALQAGNVLTLRLRADDGETLDLDTTLAPAEAVQAARPAPFRAVMAGGHAGATRLEIDRPVLAGDAALAPVQGSLTISGWAVAPAGIAEVTVLCDGQKLGQAYVGMRREDIGRTFPDCVDSLRAGYALVLPPGAVPDGEHQFTIMASSRDGEIQSRSFSVTVEPADDMLPGSTPRLSMPRAEQVFLRTILASHACAPAFSVALLASAVPGDGGTGAVGTLTIEPGMRGAENAAAGKARANKARSTGKAGVSAETAGAGKAGTTGDLGNIRGTGGVGAPGIGRAPADLSGDLEAEDAALRVTLASLSRQVYEAFTVTAASPRALALSAEYPALAGRVSLAPAAGKQPAGSAATGDADTAPDDDAQPRLFMALLPGDTLGCDALLELAAAYAMNRKHDFIYGDELRFNPVHARREPFFKPDWSPELQLGMDYVGRPWCAAQSAMERAGLGLSDLLAQPNYASVLQLTEAATGIRHINKVLAATQGVTDTASGVAALTQAAIRRGETASPVAGDVPGTWRMRRSAHYAGKVSIIMPTAGTGGLVQKAINSIRATTSPDQVEIVVLDNVPAANTAMKAWLEQHADQVIDMPGAFNWSRFNNHAAALATGDMLLFLNDDIEARAPGWLEALLEHAIRPEVAVTGARLLYPDGKIQHAGQYLAETHARHAFRFAPGSEAGPFGLARAAREMSAVTGACQMIRRDVFERLGGFDEGHDVINNDLDFCLRAQAAGLSVIYTPHAELMHHELASRAGIEDSYDTDRFTGDWRTTLLRGDRFHSRRLLADADHYAPDPEPVRTLFAGPSGPAASRIQRILAVKLDHIGDFLTAIPALHGLKQRFPGAQVSVLVPPASAVLARAQDCVDAVIEFTFFHARSGDGKRGVTDQEYAELGSRLAGHRFDMAIDLRMQPETRQVLRHSGAPFLVGYDHDGAYPWLSLALEWEGDARLLPKHSHISERLLTLVDAAAAACRPIAMPVVPPLRDPASVPALARLPADFLARRLVCIHPGVGNPVRQWPASSYAALIDLLAAEEDMHAILVGGGDEQAVARDVLNAVVAKDRVISLVGSLKLDQLAAVMEACALFVGNNSGPKHIAASLGVPTLGIHSGVVDAAEWGPLGSTAMALQRRVICGPCYLEFASDCPRGLACLTGIKPRDVLAACRRLLGVRR
jgi:ADP-heptose:LPS heptosyltransferase/GT2 family glycosyltransferase